MSVPLEKCEVCVVGAGLAGMNALFATSRHLARDQRVIVIDRRRRVGGMWIDAYPYVRLHQPHGMFTAGNIKWTLGEQPAYLASKGEVLDHFQYCLDVIKHQQRVDEFFGWTMESADEVDGVVRVMCRAADGRTMVIETKRLIKAYGFRVEPNGPLPLSSQNVHSVSPDTCDMRAAPIRDTDTPVWIVGGGKTAMDTAHTLIRSSPGREVNLLAGGGTFFNNRDIFFPRGIRRWRSGTMFSALALQVSQRFDGTNEAQVWDWHRSTYGLRATTKTGNFALGILSEAEQHVISSGLNEVVLDHLADVVDEGGKPHLLTRSGSHVEVKPGSWFVNCTGYLTKHQHPYEPYVSASGNVLSIQTQSATLHLSSYSAYFGTHLLLSGKIQDAPLYELDLLDLYRKSRKAFPYTVFALVQHNLSLYFDNIPSKAFRECGLDFDRWYPLPRRLMATAKFMRSHRAERERARRALDIVRERFDVRCGPLSREET